MLKYLILSILFLWPLCLSAQRHTDYNKKGDEAISQADYSDARMWFEEGVVQCDRYSIDRLTEIWMISQPMRSSMRSLMNKCLNCLTVMATEGDTTAISQLKIYYTEGIGIPKNEELADYWGDQLTRYQQTTQPTNTNVATSQTTPVRMQFFAGYTFSTESPFGITVGGVKSRLGWFARFRTNFTFTDAEYSCKGTGNLTSSSPNNLPYRFTNKKKKENYAALAGVVVKCTPWLYTSVGLGYGSRKMLCEFVTISDTDYRKETPYWAKNTDYSYNGLAADLDVMLRFGPAFVSGGINTLNFKHIDLNAGIGLFF